MKTNNLRDLVYVFALVVGKQFPLVDFNGQWNLLNVFHWIN